MHTVLQDLWYAIRLLRKSPVFTAVAVITLALGIGANTAIFSVIEAVLLHSLPFGDSGRVYRIDRYYPTAEQASGGFSGTETIPWQSMPDIMDIERQARAFSGTAITRFLGEKTLTGFAEPRGVLAVEVTPSFFSVLEFQPQLGRAFTNQEAEQQAHSVILTHEFWESQFSGNPAAVGQSIQLEHETYRIIGVLPPKLLVLPRNVALLFPLSITHFPQDLKSDRALHGEFLFARLAPGVSERKASAEINVIAARLRRQYRDIDTNQELALVSLRQVVAGSLRPALLMLMGAVGLVLLIACSNLSGMLLAHTAGRQREFATRMALGAGRAQIARQLLTETLVLAVLGGGAGLLLAGWILSMLSAIVPSDLPTVGRISLNLPVLAFTAVVVVLAAVLSGALPVLHLNAKRIAATLTERSMTGRRETARTRSIITVSQMGLALLLLIGAGLLLKNFARLYRQNPGFRTQGVLTFYLSFDAAHTQPPAATLLMRTLQQQWRALPGVRDAGFTTDLPLNRGSDIFFMIAGRPRPTSSADSPDAFLRVVSPGYIETVGLRLNSGRSFAEGDVSASQPVAVINEALARRYFPHQNAVGQHLTIGSPLVPDFKDIGERVIIGVLGDARVVSLHEPDQPTLYVPFAQAVGGLANFIYGGVSVAVSTGVDPAQLQSRVTAMVHQEAPEIPLSSVRTVSQLVADDLAPQRFNLLLLGAFAAVGIFLAMLGIYGVTAYSVTQRRAEIGVRLAFGATPPDILGLILGRGMRLTAAGLLVGVVSAVLLSRILQPFIYDMSATDPITYVGVAVLFLAVALAANLIPSIRALAVDPVEVLRSE